MRFVVHALIRMQDEEDAVQALLKRNHSTINGREIRVEPSRARREFFELPV